jgi:hypothetical protein
MQTDAIAVLKRVFFGAAVVFCSIVPTDAGAQSSSIAVSPNTNVLPGIDDPVRGDANLQRQNEAVAAVSTRNPNHIFIAANDYRTVDLANDLGMGETLTRVAKHIKYAVDRVLATLLRRKEFENEADEAVEKVEAGTEAWIGMYFSNDAGKSYSSFFMPGHPVDSSVVGQATPAFGHQAASDPVLAAAPAGRFYLGAMVFDRDPVTKKPAFSQIVVSTFTDRNNSETGLNFHFDRMTLVDSGVESGRKFLDKPAIVADMARKAPEADACGPVYIAYTVFDQKEANPLDRSKILLSVSNDCGANFTPGARISHRSVLNQGVNLAIRPSDGALFAAYRSFSENKIYVTYSLDGGGTFSQPQVASGTAPIVAFDQPTLGTPDGVYSFRTNGFPTIGTDGAGTVFVAWQERISADGNPRIFITSSTNGRTWSAKHPVETTRCVTTAGGPVCSPANIGPQVMPSLTFSRGRLMLAFYEARAVDDNVKFVPAVKASYIAGLDVQLAARVAQLDANGVGSSVPLTHYSIGTDGKPPLISSYGGHEYRHVNRPNLPMYAGGTLPFIGDYLSIAPIAPFVAANPPVSAAAAGKPAAPKPKPGPFWRWATEPADAPAAAFITAWGDNRDVVFPQDPATGTLKIDGPWSTYGPPGAGPCINPGSRNANVYTALVAPRLLAGTPTSFKDLGAIQRAFVVFVQNQTTSHKFYRLAIGDAPPTVDASFNQFAPDLNTVDVEVFGLSTVTKDVFAVGSAGAPNASFIVKVTEITALKGTPVPGGDAAIVVFNGDPSNPALVSNPTSEFHSPRIFRPGDPSRTTPQIDNPQIDNPQIDNPQIDNPQIDNPQIDNLQLTNSAPLDPSVKVVTNVTNYTWQVSNVGNTTSSFAPIFNVAKSLQGKRVRLFIYKTYRTPTFTVKNGTCVASEAVRDEIISVIDNPQIDNPQIDNPQIDNPQIDNATFFVAPTDASAAGAARTQAARRRAANGGLTLASFQAGAPGDVPLVVTDAPTMITLQVVDGTTPVIALPPTDASGLPIPANPPLTTQDFTSGAATFAVTATSNDVINGVVQQIPEAVTTGADLIVSTPPTPSVAPNASVPAGTVVTFSNFTVTNTGQQATSGPFQYAFYLSTSAQIDPQAAVLLGPPAIYTPSIPPSGTATLTGGSFQLPPGTAPGPYFVGVRINSGNPNAQPPEPALFEPENNDSATTAITIIPGANLIVTNLTLTPSSLVAGQTMTASVTVANVGTAPAAPSAAAFFLSTDAILSPADTLLGSVATPQLAPGGIAIGQMPLVVPGGTSPNTYTVFAKADNGTAVPESNENDNTAATSLKVVPSNTSTLSYQQQPSAVIAGHAIAPAVQVKALDAQSAPLPGALIQMSLVTISGSGVLTGTTSATTNAAGIAAFANLKVTQVGSYRLLASAPTLGSNVNVTSAAFTVTPNSAPVATGDGYSVAQGSTLNVAAPGVLVNDSDADNDPLTAVLVSGAAHGQLTLNANGSFTYTPTSGYSGPDGFVYQASDGVTTSANAAVSITVTPASVPTILFGPSNPPTPPSGTHTRDVIIPFTVTDAVGVASVSPQPVYVADIGTNRIDRVDPGNGSVVNVYTGGNRFSPIAVAISPANGKLYITEDDQRRILRMDQTGLNLEVVYDASTAVAPNNPDEAIGLAFSPSGDLFFTTVGSGATYGLWKIAAGALGTPPVQLFTIPNIGAGQGIGLVFAANGDLFIVDQSANQILKSSPPYSSASTFVGPASLPPCTSLGDVNGVMLPFCLFGVAVDATGDVFVAHADAKAILRFDSAGTSLGTFASVGPSEAPVFIQFDATGNLWVAAIDPAAFSQSQTAAPGHVYRIASNGVVTLAVGGPFFVPLGVALPRTTGNTVYGTVAFTSTSPGAVVTATNTGSQSANVTSPGVTIDKSIPGSFVVVNTNEAGEGSLRQAILNANAHAGIDTITFNIQPPGVQTIAPIGTLPFVTDPAVLDATTQPGWALGAPVIEVSGANAGPRASGLSIAAGSSTIRGFVVNRWTREGILLRTGANNTVAGNFIGTTVSGNAAAANGLGLYIASQNNIIGGTTAADRNVISGNALTPPQIAAGILVTGESFDDVTLSDSGAGTVIQGNYIGTNAAGAAAVPNNIGVQVNASNVTIGGTAANAGNLISGNRFASGGAGIASDVFSINGVLLSSGSSMTVQGNFIGTNVAGTGAIFNNVGVVLNAPSAHVGGPTAAARNVISGNSGQGIFIGTSNTGLASGANAVIEGNHIGVDSNGTAKLSNTGAGIAINALGIAVGPNNVIAGNGVTPTNSIGVVVQPTGTASIFGNFIGTNASGAPALGNLGSGVVLNSANNIVGGTSAAARNIIAGNGGSGIGVNANSGQTVSGNLIQGNYIGLAPDGDTPLANNGGINFSQGNGVNTGNFVDVNVISGNTGSGINVSTASAVTIRGNVIGLNAVGSAARPNTQHGVQITNASNAVIGGTTAQARNILSGNGAYGVSITSNSGLAVVGAVVQGNYIGTDAAGNVALPNNLSGVNVSTSGGGVLTNTTIGGAAAGAGNVISGNILNGIFSNGPVTTLGIIGNFVGTNAAGTGAVANRMNGISINGASGVTIGGNVISGNGTGTSGFGVFISSGNGNVVQGNTIGTNVAGSAPIPNANGGVSVTGGTGNQIGGPGAMRNVISGNGACVAPNSFTCSGISVSGAANGTSILGNYIGTNLNGNAALPNLGNGVVIGGGTSTQVGSSTPGTGNLISGNGTAGAAGVLGNGVSITGGSNNSVRGNFVGTNAAGSAAVANVNYGVYVADPASNTTIGGTTAAERNIISGNGVPSVQIGSGVEVNGSGVSVQGNYIGIDMTGTFAIPNNGDGVTVAGGATNVTIGGTTAGAGNLISGNGLVASGSFAYGVELFGTTSNTVLVQGNSIGTNAAGTGGVPNFRGGIFLTNASNASIGGTAAGAGNTIAFNSGPGIVTNPFGGGNSFRNNSIFSNTGLGIDLAGDGVTANDPNDTDTGSNGLQNFPVVTNAVIGSGAIFVDGTLNSTANATFSLDFYASAACDPSGFGQGATFLGSLTLSTNGSGNAAFSQSFAFPLGTGSVITASATDSAGSSSEFSQCRTATTATTTANLSLTKIHTTPSPTLGQPLTYSMTVGNAGPDQATVTLKDPLPAGVSFVSATSTKGVCGLSGGIVTCALGTMANGASATITLVVTPTAAQPITNTAMLTSDASDPNPSNNTASDSLVVGQFGPCAVPTFSSFVANNVQAQATFLATGDFNKDGLQDVAVSDGPFGYVRVFLADGQNPGEYIHTDYPTGLGSPNGIVVLDFDGDTNLDLAVAVSNGPNSRIALLKGSASGAFAQTPLTTTVAAGPSFPFGADFNGDGRPDLAVGNTAGTTISVLLWDGTTGNFKAPVQYSSGPSSGVNAIIEDFNSDGKLDIATPNIGSSFFTILSGNGDGTFAQPATTIPLPSPYLMNRLRKVGDVNGDGKPDLGATLTVTNTPLFANLALLYNTGGFSFGAPVEILPESFGVGLFALGDVTGDGKPDLVTISNLGATSNTPGSVLVMPGDGTGNFGAPVAGLVQLTPNVAGAQFQQGQGGQFELVDLNGDGGLDVIGTGPVRDIFFVMYNTCATPTTSDLLLTMTGPGTVAAGSDATYHVTVTNNGPDPAHNVALIDFFGTDSYVGATSTEGFECGTKDFNFACWLGVQDQQTGEIQFATLAAGASASFDVTLKVFSGTHTHRATVTALEADPNNANSNASATTTATAVAVTRTVTNTDDEGPGSLRQAMLESNANVGPSGSPNTIVFNIPANLQVNGAFTIRPSVVTPLPTITTPVVIDGTTQQAFMGTPCAPGAACAPIIEVSGEFGGGGNGINIQSNGSTIRGFVLNRWGNNAIQLVTSTVGGNIIAGNYIGTTVAGNAAQTPANFRGMLVQSPNNVIGGTTAADRNVISGNGTGGGILVNAQTNASNAVVTSGAGTVIQGNYIGLKADGSSAIGGASNGVSVTAGRVGNVFQSPVIVGGTAAGAGNVIAGHFPNIGVSAQTIAGTATIISDGAGTVIQGNFIGTNAAGTAAGLTGLTTNGINISVPNVTVGCDDRVTDQTNPRWCTNTPGAVRNVIAGNGSGGIGISVTAQTVGNNSTTVIETGHHVVIMGNYVGLNATGSALGNSTGITVSAADGLVGGTTAAGRNVISGNGPGIRVNAQTVNPGGVTSVVSTGTGTVVRGNYIGTDVAGTTAIPNGNDGVNILVPNVTVGCDDRITNSADPRWCGAIGDARNVIGGHTNGSGIFVGAQTIQNTTTVLTTGSNAVIQGNYVGVKADGSGVLANVFFGIKIHAVNGLVGGTTAAGRNVVSGNTGGQILVGPHTSGSVVLAEGQGTVVQGNYLGTNPAGTAGMTNSGSGVSVTVPNVTIAGNVISANPGGGVNVGVVTLNNVLATQGTNAIIQGNYIGTNAAGSAPLGNTGSGVSVQVANVTVGGAVPGARNVISGNTSNGVNANGFVLNNALAASPSPITIQGNYIGTDATGTAAIANNAAAIVVSAPNATIVNNLISGNNGFGIDLPSFISGGVKYSEASSATIKGNFIGTSAGGAAPALPNTRGISVASANAHIGGTSSGDRNVISGNNGLGIFVGVHFNGAVVSAVGTGATIEGNYIGTNAAGTTAIPNTSGGISATGSSTSGGTVTGLTIGGAAQGAGNLISGNGSNGIGLNTFVTGAAVQGNLIGTNAAGTTTLGNTGSGISISASNNVVGGATAAARNVISGNGGGIDSSNNVGINISGSSNTIQGNYIGLNPAGASAVPNSYGISVTGNNNTIGGSNAGEGNVVSGNLFRGIFLIGNGNFVQGNLIGTNAAGTARVENKWFGIQINGNNNTVGGTTAGARNIISGNGFDTSTRSGISFFGTPTGNVVQGNYIGTDINGTSAIGNAGGGIHFAGTSSGAVPANNVIGGVAAGAANVIAFNNSNGVTLMPGPGTGNAIRGNSIFSNTGGPGLGIDLGGDGVTANDAGDGDTGPNNFQNFPLLTQAAFSGGTITLSASLNSIASTTFAVDFYVSPSCDASGNGEGATFLGSASLTTNGSSNGSVAGQTFPFPNGLGNIITATATDPAGNTSEFSACATANGIPTTTTDSVTMTSDTSLTFNPAANDSDPDIAPPVLLQTVSALAPGAPNLVVPNEAVVVQGVNRGYFGSVTGIGIFDPTTNAITGSIPLNSSNSLVSAVANQTTGYVYLRYTGNLVVVNSAINAIVQSLVLGTNIPSMAMDETHKRLYAATTTFSTGNPTQSRVVIVDVDPLSATFNQVSNQVALAGNAQISRIAVNSQTNKVYFTVASGTNAGLNVMDGTSFAVSLIPNTSSPVAQMLAVNEVKNLIYAATNSSTLYCIDGSTDTRIAAIAMPAPLFTPPVINSANGRVYVRTSEFPSSSRLVIVDGDPANGATFNTIVAQPTVGRDFFLPTIAVDPVANRVITSAATDRQTSIFNATTGAFVANLPVSNSINSITIDPVAHRAYVAGSFGFFLQVVDLTTATVLANIQTGIEVDQLVADPATHTAYIPRTGVTTEIQMVDSTGQAGILAANTPGNYLGRARNSVTGRIYVGNFGAAAAGSGDGLPGYVTVIDGATRSVLANVAAGNRPGSGAYTITVDEAQNKIYVANGTPPSAFFPGGISVINGANNAVSSADLSALPPSASVLSISRLLVNPATGRVYFAISAGSTAKLGVLDGTTNIGTAHPLTFGATENILLFRVDQTLNHVYVVTQTGLQSGAIRVVDGSNDQDIGSIAIGLRSPLVPGSGQSYVAVNQTTGRIFAVDYSLGTLSVYNGSTLALVKTIAVGNGPTSVAVNEPFNRIYVANALDKTLMIIDGSTLAVESTLPLPLMPVDLGVDDSISRIFIVGGCISADSACISYDAGVMVVDDPGNASGTLVVTAVTQGAHGSVTLNADGTITYTPNPGFSGNDSFTYTVSDGHGGTANGTVNVTIKAQIAISPTSLPAGQVGVSYNQTLTATGGTGPYQWTVTSVGGNTLPSGLILHSTTAVLDGVPTQAGTFTFTVQARDAASPPMSGSRAYTVVINP